MKPTAALFDLDGVIVDTERQYTTFWQEIGEKYFPEDATFSMKIKGQTLVDIYARYFPDDSSRQEEVTQALNDFEARMKYPYVPGIMEFLARLRAAGYKTAIVTSSNKAKMANIYQAHPELLHAVDRIFTAEDATRSKPAPDCYINAARSFGFTPEECFVFEDSFNGLRAGRASGARVIGLSTSNSAESIAPMCDLVWPDFLHATVDDLCS